VTAGVLSFSEAMALVERESASAIAADIEHLPLLEGRGRVLAEAVRADRDQPPFARSTRDGFAVRAVECAAGAALRVVGEVRAGEAWSGPPLGTGEALGIMTGAPLPEAADSVAMIEHVQESAGQVRLGVGRTLVAGQNVVQQGSEARAGDEVLGAGTRVTAAAVAAAANCGYSRITVYRRPRVAIVATGDELVELDAPIDAHQIRNSNSYALAALVAEAGGEALRLPIAPDRPEAVKVAIDRARGAQLLVLSGGVSMGRYDFVEQALAAAGAEFFFTGVRMQPGRPVVFGRLPATANSAELYFFGLPGNPVSTQVTFHAFAGPMLAALGGARVRGPRFVLARLDEPVAGRAELTRLLPARLHGVEVSLVPWQGSGDLAANARADGYVLLPERAEGFAPGEAVRVLLP
jgi:molybdopterin molybdotransferase